MKYSNSN